MAIIFYGALGILVPFLWIGLIFFMMGTEVTAASYGTELFPTRNRSTASGIRGVISTIGSAIGLAAVSGASLVDPDLLLWGYTVLLQSRHG
jgi:hypothetical protein